MLGGKRERTLLFSENRKRCPDFGKKGRDCIHLCVKFSIQNVVLRVSRRRYSKIFRNLYHTETSSLISSAKQRTNFCKIETSIMKETSKTRSRHL